jgi:hypothetical protein
MSGTVGNADLWTVVFVDANDTPTDPDANVIWQVIGVYPCTVLEEEVQAVGDKVATGTFEFEYTPTSAKPYTVKVRSSVGGVPQSSPATRREVTR